MPADKGILLTVLDWKKVTSTPPKLHKNTWKKHINTHKTKVFARSSESTHFCSFWQLIKAIANCLLTFTASTNSIHGSLTNLLVKNSLMKVNMIKLHCSSMYSNYSPPLLSSVSPRQCKQDNSVVKKHKTQLFSREFAMKQDTMIGVMRHIKLW